LTPGEDPESNMAYVPKNAAWYWAEVIEEITVEGDPRNVVHRNLVLIRADSPEEAYERALEIGKQHESSYQNPEGALVQTRFREARWLGCHTRQAGAWSRELLYQEDIGVSPNQIEKWICPKNRLPLFRKEEGPDLRPDYSSKEIVDQARRLMES